jgi:starch-binding outer membrane protein, SusD/RagB family
MKKILCFLSVLSLGACSNFLIENPEDVLTTENFFRTEGDAIAAVTGVYARLNKGIYNRVLYLVTDLQADDATVGKGVSNPLIRVIDSFEHGPVNDPIENAWTQHYEAINRTNFVIARVPGVSMTEALRNRLVAEAKFLRGLFYFNLVRMYGDVPLIVQPTESLDGLNVSRTSTAEVYTQIVKDISEAEAALPTTYPTADLGRVTKGAATALLAKVYLTQKNWQLAAQKSKEVIDSRLYSLHDDYAKIFQTATENTVEYIFSAQFTTGLGVGTVAANGNSMMALQSPQSPVITGLQGNEADIPTAEAIALYKPGDRRAAVTLFSSYTLAGRVSTFSPLFFKYFDPASLTRANDSGVNVPVLRYADVLLMYAEALNEIGGPTAEAYAQINAVRRRARIANVPNALPDLANLTQTTFRQAIYDERRLEFMMENHRWFDLLRTNRAISVMTAAGKAIKPYNVLLPIPQRERDTNKSLTQNPGYQ